MQFAKKLAANTRGGAPKDNLKIPKQPDLCGIFSPFGFIMHVV